MAARLASHRRTVFRMAIVVGLASITLGTAGFAASRLYPAFGSIKAASDAQSWAGHPLAYSAGTCASCHAAETIARYGTVHAGVNCQGCHGPLAGHPADDEGSDPLVVPASEICVTCHAFTAGRPGALPQVDPTSHYSGGICLRCHDPHSVVAVAPPDVTHPLTDLPACTTCHAPDGLKQVPAGHEMVEDAVCLSCHGVPTNGR